MKKNDLLRYEDKVIRVLRIQEDKVLVIDLVKCTMPVWMNPADLCTYVSYAEELFYSDMNFEVVDEVHIHSKDKEIMYQRYAMVTAILPFVTDEKMRYY